MKKLIPALCMLLVAATLLGTSTYAWFSMNKTVTAEGMSVKATTSESLVIGEHANLGTNADVKITFAGFTNPLTPITYKTGFTSGSSATPEDTYVYCSNTANVDPNTGNNIDGKTLEFAKVPDGGKTAETTFYYVDYVAYIAAAGSAMTGKTLTATVDFGGDANASGTQKAVTVAFTLMSATSSDVTVATLPVTTEPTVTAAAKDDSGSGVTVTLGSGLSIPVNAGGTSIPVLMRIYFDGALQDDSNNAFVKSASVNTNALSIKVDFTVN